MVPPGGVNNRRPMSGCLSCRDLPETFVMEGIDILPRKAENAAYD